jgi:hypothetical protein
MTHKKESNRKTVTSKIIYKQYNDKIIILAFENIYTWEEIKKMYGEDVARLYFSSGKSYNMYDKNLLYYKLCSDDQRELYVGEIIHENKFNSIVEIMQIAGENLSKVRKIKASIVEI